MKKRRNNSHHASTLQVALSTGLISISAILLVIAAPTNTKKAPRHDPLGFQLQGSTDSVAALGNYPDTSISLSGDTTVTPDAVPTDTTSINVSTNTNFKGTFAANPTTGVITVTDAHPASAYTVAVTAFGPGGTTTKTFTLTVTSTPCGAGLTAGFSLAADVDASFAASVAIGDFNGDGIQDLAVANYGLDTVSIRLGDGLGGFNGSTEVSMGAHPISAAIGDFNGDGKQDLVVAHLDSGTLSIRLGDGLGGFSGSTEVSVGSGAFSVAIGDFNSDGKQDLAAGHFGSSPTVSIRLGDGLGGFSGSAEVSVGSGAHSVAIGDFNSDGKQDLAVANALSNTVSIRLGDGLGGFSGSAEVSVGPNPLSVAIGDFNGDGKQDLAVASAPSNTVSIRLGDGSGGFSGSTEVSLSYPPSSVAIGDFNGDGEQDLAVASQRSDLLLGTVSIRLGDGLGGFTGSTEVSMGYEPNSIAIGDFNGDGKQDLAVANFGSNTVSIRLGQCITPAAQALNLSTRMLVQTGDNVGIGGFIITGSAPKQVLLRGIGPSLTGSGLPDAMADPVMELHGPGGFITIINDNWMDTQAAAILATGLAPTDNLESAILVTLNPGPYTAIVKGKDNTTGVALVELYDLDQAADSKLANISTRAFVNTGSNVVIAGFILGGNSGDDNIVVRGIGPSLAAFGVPSVLADPTLELRNSNGALLIANNDWQDDPVQAGIIAAAGLAPSNALESAIAATLSPGQYTAILAGANSTTGNGVVEVYDLGTGTPVPTPTAGGTATPTATATPGGTPSPTPVGSPSPTPVASPTPGVDPCWPESFDGVTAPALPASWVATNPDPGDGTLWVTSTTSPDSAPNDAFIPDQDGISDKVLDRLGVTITGAAVMTFRNNFNTEFSGGVYWDGFVLEVSAPNISGGDFLDITDSHVGGSFVSGGYTGEIDGSANNPLAGRMAWSGSSGGYIDTVIDLGPNLVGQTATFRFRMGSDEAVAAPGVRIDDVAFTNASCP